jgi:hypothetical protein
MARSKALFVRTKVWKVFRMPTRARLVLACGLAAIALVHCGSTEREYDGDGETGATGSTDAGSGGASSSTGSGGTKVQGGSGGKSSAAGSGAGGNDGGGSSSDGGSNSSGGTGGTGGTNGTGEGGAGDIENTACPTGQPGLLNTFENNSFEVCPPRTGFWAYTHGDATTPCPVTGVCTIGDGLTSAHPHVLRFEPNPDGSFDYLELDLRTAEGPPSASAGSYTGIRFDALGTGGVLWDLIVEGYTTDNVYHENNPDGAPGGLCVEPGGDCWVAYYTTVGVSGVAWEQVSIDFDTLTRDAQPENATVLDPAKLLYLRFYISGDFNFSLDNVELY